MFNVNVSTLVTIIVQEIDMRLMVVRREDLLHGGPVVLVQLAFHWMSSVAALHALAHGKGVLDGLLPRRQTAPARHELPYPTDTSIKCCFAVTDP